MLQAVFRVSRIYMASGRDGASLAIKLGLFLAACQLAGEMTAQSMPLFILNESTEIAGPADLTVFATLSDAALPIEPIDVENRECCLFDTDGRFFDICATGEFDRYGFVALDRRPVLARDLVETYFKRLDWTWDRSADLVGNASLLGVEGGAKLVRSWVSVQRFVGFGFNPRAWSTLCANSAASRTSSAITAAGIAT